MILVIGLISANDAVYRVNWFRAKARSDRWGEELKIVKKEMEWTMNWFEWQTEEWKKRGDKTCREGMRGHTCYAEKQQVLWQAMWKQAHSAFVNVMGLQLQQSHCLN
jgi:hypothetical protein